MSRPPLRVVKVGGSLFDPIELPERIRDWLASQTPAHHVMIAGGGPLVEQIRAWDRQRSLATVAAHWVCVDLLTATARLLHAWLPEIALVDDQRSLGRRIDRPGATIFSPAAWLRGAEPRLPGAALPPDWETTSDAVAGRLAAVLGAEQLILMKSTLPPEAAAGGWTFLAAIGYVDAVLARMAPELPPTRLVDLRSQPSREVKVG